MTAPIAPRSEERLPLFLLISVGIHALLLLFFAIAGLVRPQRLPIFTEVSLVGALPQGETLSGQQSPGVPAPGKTAPRAKTTDTQKAAARSREALKRKRVKAIQQAEKDAPIGLEAVDASGPGLADAPEDGGGQAGVPTGARVSGAIAQRRVLESYTPDYPAWARQQGVTAEVTLEVCVQAGGAVDSSTRVLRTSGYKELDQLALRSMLRWQFEALPQTVVQEKQWGVVTYTFMLR